jgi:small subunit ribosomal protein S4
VNIPSYLVKPSDVVTLIERSRELPIIKESVESAAKRGFPQWLTVDTAKLAGTFLSIPTREEIALPVQEQLIVELYSK